MKLLQWGHVFSDVGNSLSCETTLSPSALQWGHVFSDVETRRGNLQRDAKVSFNGPRLFRRGNNTMSPATTRIPGFNGATSFQTWKHREKIGTLLDNIRFNGATSFQTWKPGKITWCSKSCGRFNGATSFQTWKHQASSFVVPCSSRLQWGHVFSDVETRLLPNIRDL